MEVVMKIGFDRQELLEALEKQERNQVSHERQQTLSSSFSHSTHIVAQFYLHLALTLFLFLR